jgi:hypothetical protein
VSRTSSLFDQLRSINERGSMSEAEEQALWDSVDDNAPAGTSTRYVPVPDGQDHIATIKNIGVSQNYGKSPALFAEMYFQKFNTNETGYWNIDRTKEGAIKALKGALRGLGITAKSGHPDEIARLVATVNGSTIKVTKKTKANPGGRDFRNYYVNGVIEKPVTAQVTADEIPF